jgi:hypothetical protein
VPERTPARALGLGVRAVRRAVGCHAGGGRLGAARAAVERADAISQRAARQLVVAVGGGDRQRREPEGEAVGLEAEVDLLDGVVEAGVDGGRRTDQAQHAGRGLAEHGASLVGRQHQQVIALTAAHRVGAGVH